MALMTTLSVPATTANLGPGFDCIGAALTMYNQFQFALTDSPQQVKITVEGEEAARVTTDKSNLVYQSFERFYQHLGKNPPKVEITINLGVPLARGLGSSATAIVGGLMGANQLAGSPLSKEEILELAIAIEGHPDNVVPALLGNCQLAAATGNNWQICPVPWQENLVPVVAIPNFELSTEEARAVLPQELSREDAIFNIARMGLLIRGLATGRREWLEVGMEDQLHQPYRQSLIRGYQAVKSAAIAAGAYGMAISGAGPTLLAITDKAEAEAVAAAMAQTWQTEGVKAEVRSLSLHTQAINNEQ